MFNEKVEPQGWLTFAQNSDTVNYVNQAYLLALSIKRTCAINKFAVVVDTESAKTITPNQRKVFDYVIEVPRQDNPFALECSALELTPFKETFKLESDMIVPRSLDHWWDGCRIQDVCYTTRVRDYQGKVANTRYYRKFFDVNNLTDAYNGFTYFRYSRASTEFFNTIKSVCQNWDTLRDRVLSHCIYDKPDTDVLYSLAQSFTGNSHFNKLTYPTFTHMKGAVNGWKPNIDWRNAVPWTLTKDYSLIVGGYAQQYPFHYFQKDFCTPELIQRYER
tara:strand:- start:2128 stop:2955 length:828 start_codon:yes stop_codon:yes gene_type:complete